MCKYFLYSTHQIIHYHKDKDGVDYSSKNKYPEAANGSGMTDYAIHPAFTFGSDELAGFWVGKFESSNNGGKIQIKGGVQSWRSITVSNIYNTCRNMNTEGNIYGLSEDDNEVDPHMMKNTEWGAVAYLSKSIYGKNEEVEINSNSSYYTGGGSGTTYRSSVGQSTTGNVYGVYDMSGGAWEYTAAYVGSGNSNGSSLVSAPAKYKDVYSTYQAPSASGIYGDAVWETSSSSSSSSGSWYNDCSYFPNSGYPFFERGGRYSSGSSAGLFAFGSYNGCDYDNLSFRVVVPVL